MWTPCNYKLYVSRILQLFRHWQGIESAAISIIGVSDIKEVCAVIIFMTKPVTFKNHIFTSQHNLINFTFFMIQILLIQYIYQQILNLLSSTLQVRNSDIHSKLLLFVHPNYSTWVDFLGP